MFKAIRRRLADMQTLRLLCERAEAHARERGAALPGAQHFLLAALDLPDGAAARVFARLQVDPQRVPGAIEEQYRNALSSVGLDGAHEAPEPLAAPAAGMYRAQASAQALMQVLAKDAEMRAGRGLSGAHVLAALAKAEQGVAARTLRVLGVGTEQLSRAAHEEISALPA